ncbi:MAG: phosphoribosyltransferase family protein [Brevinema sp.]
MLSQIIRFFTHQQCIGCGKNHASKIFYCICDDCASSIPLISEENNRCPVCFDRWFKDMICQNCLSSTVNWQSLSIIFSYQHCIIKSLFFQYKFQNSLLAERDLTNLLRNHIHDISDYEIIIAPCSKRTKKFLGFNPVARILDNLHISYHDLLVKNKDSKIQKTLSGQERRTQINPFLLKHEIPKYLFKKKILVIDDIFTTGSTISNIIALLKTKGLENIEALCFLRD